MLKSYTKHHSSLKYYNIITKAFFFFNFTIAFHSTFLYFITLYVILHVI